MKVLIINHDKQACGTYQFCQRINSIVFDSLITGVLEGVYYRDIHNRDEYLAAISEIDPEYVIYNWHVDRINWLLQSDITQDRKHYFLFHDGSTFPKYDKYIFCGEIPTYNNPIPREKSILLPRPIMEYTGEYPKNDVPTIGSFGFATDHKRFPDLVGLVGRTFDKAVINLHITSPYFGVTKGYNLPDIVNRCRKNNSNPKIQLNITTHFIDNQELLKFLAGNDLNVFNYEILKQPNPGISSATDYALSVRRPFAVTRNSLFRHVAKNEILLEKNNMKDIINRGLEPFQEFYDKWSPDNFRKEFNRMFE